MAMAVQTVRAAAQLREAAREMARIAMRRARAGTELAEVPGEHTTLAEEGRPGIQLRNSRAQSQVPVGPVQPSAETAYPWPLQTFLALEPMASAVPRSRQHVRHLLRDWDLTEFSESAELVVSELITNSVQASSAAGPATAVRLWLMSDRRTVLILVQDSSPLPPVPIGAAEDAETGRGLLLVDAVSSRWDWYYPIDLDGKVVWAEIGKES